MSTLLLTLRRINLWHFVWIAVALSVFLSLLLSELIHGQIVWEYPVSATFIACTVASLLIYLINRLRHLEQALGEQTGQRVQDALERWRAEDTLRESQVRFSSALKDAAIGMALVGTDGQWLQVNPALCALVGYTEHELLATTFQAITHPDDLDADLAFVRQMLAGEIPAYHMEKRYFHKQGHIVWILLSVSLVRDPFGQPLYFIAQIQDITTRKRSESALRESEQRFKAFMDHSPAVAFMKDAQGRYVYVNKRLEHRFERAAVEWLGKTDYELWSPETAQQFCKHDKEALAAQAVIERIETTPDQTLGVREWTVFKFPVEDASGNRYLGGVAVDITERRQAEKALYESEARFRAILENSPNMVFLKDTNGRYLLVNRQFERTFHVTCAEISGKTDDEIFPAAQAAAFQENDRKVFEAGVAMPFEEVALHDDGPHTSIVFKFPLHTTDGALYGIGGITADITERKRVEDELLALKDDLATELMAMSRLHEFSTRLLTSEELQPLLEEVLNATIALQDADFGNVQLYNPHTHALEIVAHRGFQQDFLEYFGSVQEDSTACGRALHRLERVIIEDVLTDPGFELHRPIAASAGFRAVQSTPLFSRNGVPLGMISTHFRQAHRPSESELRLTDLYARQAAEMIERKRAEEALRHSEQRLRQALEDRERLSQDLHDHVIQSIYAVGLTLETCQYLIDNDPAGAAHRLQQGIADLNGVMTQLRNYIEWGSLTTIKSDQLHEALDELIQTVPNAQSLAIQLHMDPPIGGQLTDDEATHVLHIVREALSNSLRHARATTGLVSFRRNEGGFRLEVHDDGVGFDIASKGGHGWGLRNMAARASKLRAELKILSDVGCGTRIILDIPKDQACPTVQ